ncbi:MAG: hypothetical protein HN855_10030 [Anaerolineae bacterium]|nr:hypothetical protein [Anaerolineae bacterium]MBT7325488.1 hypothetical protein [Anaerolineae bacterium]MBT7601453.1 hypothetical protein [Anaerolineae bacterium]
MSIKRLLCNRNYTLKTFFWQPIQNFYFEKTGRLLGCQSKNHSQCEGELWICERCGKRICWEEGSTDLIELCDDCWVAVRVKYHHQRWWLEVLHLEGAVVLV